MVVAIAWTPGAGPTESDWSANGPGYWALVDWNDSRRLWTWEIHVDELLHDEGESATADEAKAAVLGALNRSGWDWPATDE